MHEPYECDRSTETDCTQFEEVCGKASQPNPRDLRAHCPVWRWHHAYRAS
jgi:hypothetical protein